LKAKALQQEVEEASLTKGDLLSQNIASLRQKLSQDKEISLTEKRQMLADVDKLKEELIRQEKEAAKELLKVATELGSTLDVASGGSFKVFAVPELKGDAKAMGACLDALGTKDDGKGFCLVSAGSSNLAVVATVPKNLSTIVAAKAWVDSVLTAVNGKGGGNAYKAQGQSQETEKINEAVKAARDFVSSHK
jgi:alanyl-tRNA synthetase